MILCAQCFVESVSAVSQSASRYEDAHIAAFASFELGMSKAQSAQNAAVSFCSSLRSMSWYHDQWRIQGQAGCIL